MEESGWVKFNGRECPVDEDSLVVVHYINGTYGVGKAEEFMDYETWGDEVVAYKVLNHYRSSRQKVIVNNTLELHELILKQKVIYFSKDGFRHVKYYEGEFIEKDLSFGDNVETFPFSNWNVKEWWIE